MLTKIKLYFLELQRGAQILFSREFWEAFKHYWSSEEIAKRIDEWTKNVKR